MSTFTEEQRFSKYFTYPIIMLLTSITAGILCWGIVQQIILGKPYGNIPVSDSYLLITGIFPLIIVLVVDWLLIKAKLITEISGNSIRYKFYPFIQRDKTIYWEEVEKAYVRKYKPICEYGGWGIRFGIGGKGRALNMKGKYGLQLEFKNGKKLLIGTQKPEELEKLLISLGMNSIQSE
jgi:hypothetical protein